MTTGIVYGISGKMFIGAITNVAGAGGEEIKGVEGREFEFDTGFALELVREGNHFDVIKKANGPALLNVPMHDMDVLAVQEILRPYWDATGASPSGGVATNRKLPGVGILILPQVATDGAGNDIRAIFIKAAKLHPESQKVLTYSVHAPILPQNTTWVATSEAGDGGKEPWLADKTSVLTTEYF